MKTITIKEETPIPGTDYVLESGDKIRIKENETKTIARRVNDATGWKVFDYAVESPESDKFAAYSDQLKQIYLITLDNSESGYEADLIKDNATISDWDLIGRLLLLFK